jgi:hypothetical protein
VGASKLVLFKEINNKHKKGKENLQIIWSKFYLFNTKEFFMDNLPYYYIIMSYFCLSV